MDIKLIAIITTIIPLALFFSMVFALKGFFMLAWKNNQRKWSYYSEKADKTINAVLGIISMYYSICLVAWSIYILLTMI